MIGTIFFNTVISLCIGSALYDLFIKIDIRENLAAYIFCTLLIIGMTTLDCFGSIMLLKQINLIKSMNYTSDKYRYRYIRELNMEVKDISELNDKKLNKVRFTTIIVMGVIDHVSKELNNALDSGLFDSKDDFSILFSILLSGVILLPFKDKENREKRLEFAEDVFNKVREMLSITQNDEKFDNIFNELWPTGLKYEIN